MITTNQGPDHTTIARFRQTHESTGQILDTGAAALSEAGLVKVGVVALDGNKIKAHAALAAIGPSRRSPRRSRGCDRGPGHGCGEIAIWPGAVRRRIAGGPAGSESRRARVQACQERLTQEAATATAQQQAKIETRQAEEAATGQKKRGRKPKAPEAAADRDAKATVTDPDSRIMKTQAGMSKATMPRPW